MILGIFAAMPTQAAGPAPVNLRTAGRYVILSKAGISTTGVTSIVGDIGVSPIAATAITGFDLILSPTRRFSTSAEITGKVYASDYAAPTPARMSAAVADMETAYTDAEGRTLPDFTELYSGDLTGQTLTPGLYKWGTGVLVSAGGVTISGGPTDVWIFQIAQDLTVEAGAIVTLAGGASAANIFWQVAGETTLGTTARMKGIVLCATQIAMNTGARLVGRALAQTAVTLDANVIYMAVSDNAIFIDGFETGNTSRWSATIQ
ncbi:MAG: ice-binding family protein [Thermoanaerobaculia bacterium]